MSINGCKTKGNSMSYEVLKCIHLSMIFLVLLNLGGAAIHMLNGGSKDFKSRKMISMTSGLALLVIAASGWMLAMKIYSAEPIHHWVYAKFIVWLYLGGVTALIYRKPKSALQILISILIVASIGSALAIFKGF